MKQCERALPQEGPCFKLKAGIFVGPQIHKLMKNKHFWKTMNARETETWTAFISVTNFLGNKNQITRTL